MACCPNCGTTFSTTRTIAKAVTLPERSDIDRAYANRDIKSKDDYFDACKRIALRDDLRFLVRVAGARMTPEVLSDARALLSELEVRAGKPADAKAINRLRDRYRMSLPSLIPHASDRALAAVA